MKQKFSVSVEDGLLKWLDSGIKSKRFASRSHGQLILKLSNTLELMPSKQIQYNYHNSSHI